MAKLNWAESYLALDFSDRDSRNAAEVSPNTRNYLQTLKFRQMQYIVGVDLADTSHNNLLTIAKYQAKIELLNELLTFFNNPVAPGDETLIID